MNNVIINPSKKVIRIEAANRTRELIREGKLEAQYHVPTYNLMVEVLTAKKSLVLTSKIGGVH